MGPRVLVVDDDPWILRMVVASLERQAYVVDGASSGRQALAMADRNPPDLVISDIMMPDVDGWTLIRRLRQDNRLCAVPVIVLTALEQDSSKLNEFGIDPAHHVSKPFRFRDLQAAIKRALTNRSAPATPPPLPPAVRSNLGASPTPCSSAPAFPPVATPSRRSRATALDGRLEQVRLSSLLTMMEMERKDGSVTISTPDGETGQIDLRSGRVIRASLASRPDAPGRDCVFIMLTWRHGWFSFKARRFDDAQDTVRSSTTHLLLEGARLIDEARHNNH